jgi:hypothetical protein
MVTFQLYWWMKTSGAPLYIISGTNGHLSRTTDIPLTSWTAFSHEKRKTKFRITIKFKIAAYAIL